MRRGNKNFTSYSPQIENINIGNGSYTKIGIISDLHLSKLLENKETRFKYFTKNTYIALKYFKKNKIDILIIVGDITHDGELKSLLYFKKIFNSIFDNNYRPKLISFMGNHDYHDFKVTNRQNQQKFFNIINCYSNSHYVINGFNFIFWSQDNYLITEQGIINYKWIKTNLNLARQISNNKGKPIFVFTHIPPKRTVYGSETVLGHEGIYNVLKDYHEVICISAHSHHSLKNIKSIWQGDFTVINTQSISYINSGNFSINKNQNEVKLESAKNCYSMGLIAHLTDKNILFERVEFLSGYIMKEKWKIDFPINIKNFTYTFEKRNKKEYPIFHNPTIKIENKKINHILNRYIIFNAATHSHYINKYKIIFKSKRNKRYEKNLYYYSDYFKSQKKRNDVMKFKLPNNIKPDVYIIEVFAYDSFENESQPIKGEIKI